jgi:hypothetical protein
LHFGPKYIPQQKPPAWTTLQRNLLRFKADAAKAIFFQDQSEISNSRKFNAAIYIKSTWTPTMPKEFHDKFKSLFASLKNYYFTKTKKKEFNEITPLLNFLQAHKDIKVVNTDKNLGLALVYSSHYHKLCLDHINDRNSYRRIKHISDFTISHQQYYHLSQLNERALLLFKYYPNLKAFLHSLDNKFKVPKFKVLFKLHKTPISGRPIAGACSWISTNISKLLSVVLEDLMPQLKFLLNNSTDLIKKLENHRINSNDLLVTLVLINFRYYGLFIFF